MKGRYTIALLSVIMITTSVQAAQIWVEPAYLKTSKGDNFTVKIMVDPEGAEVMGAEYKLYFNNTLLNAANQMHGTFLGGIAIVNDINNSFGKTMYGEFRTGSAGTTTPGVLASINFEVIGEHEVCELVLKDVMLSDPDAQEIPNVTVSNESVRIGEIPPYIVEYTISNRTITPPQTTEIDVKFSEKVSYRISIEKGTATIYDWTGTAINPNIKVWNGTYEANDSVAPDGDYTVNITGTNTTTGLRVVNNKEVITLNTEPDLLPTAIKSYHYEWWEEYNVPKGDPWFNLTNYVNVTVKNNGSGSASNFKVRLYADAELLGEEIISLAAGSSTDVKFEWEPAGKDLLSWVDTPYGSKITYTTTDKTYNLKAAVDEDDEIAEENEANNNLTALQKVVWNGYTGDEPLQNYIRGRMKGGILYTTGDGAYQGVNLPGTTYGTYCNVTYDLEIPGTPELSRLYIYYTWAQSPTLAPKIGVTLTTPSGTHTLSMDKGYNDYKGEFGIYRYPWGTYAYNISEYVNESGTYEISITNLNDGSDTDFATKYAFAAPAILVVYENTSMPMREYWINEGADVLLGGRKDNGGYLAWWECMNNATFEGSASSGNATLGIVSMWADYAPDDEVYFNNHSLGRGIYCGYNDPCIQEKPGLKMTIGSGSQVSINASDVTSYLAASNNRLTQADDGDNMMPVNAFLLVEAEVPPAVTDPTASHEIPDDTDNIPLWGETAQLNVTVTDDSGVASVTVNLSEIGGSSTQPMINIGDNIYSATTNATAGTPPELYNLTVNATDIYGNSNTSTVIQLRVMKNGDTTGNDKVNIGDALRLANNVSYPGNPAYALSSIYVADVTGNGIINIGDALRVANNVSYPGNPAYVLK
jgi:hypothetical protein